MTGGLVRRLRELVRPGQIDRETLDEMRHHIDMLVARKVAAGLDEAEAHRQARLELGRIESAREAAADQRTGVALEQFARETAYAVRVLKRSPGLSLLSIATIGAGIGVSTILFVLVNSIVLRPLPYPEPDRLVRIFDTNVKAGLEKTGVASANVHDWGRRATMFEGVAAFYAMGRTTVVDGEADVLITAQVSHGFFDLMRVAPAIGRSFTEEETRRAVFNQAVAPTGANPVVMLSFSVWRDRYGADPGVIGRTLQLERRPFTIVGVMPAGFAMPDATVKLWIPWHISSSEPRDQHYLGAIARLKPDVTIDEAQAQLNSVAEALGAEYPTTNRDWRVRLSPLVTETIAGTDTILWVLFASVGVVLLVACANVALLALIRGLDRAEETALRLALGASSQRLVREFLLESSVIAVAGGALGAAVAVAGLRVLPTLATELPRITEITFDRPAILFITAVTTLSALLSGLPQAWRRTRVAPVDGLKTVSRRSSRHANHHRLRDAIVVVQVAMSVVLLAAAGLLLRSFMHLRATDPGFDPSGVLVAPIFLDNQAYTSGEHSRTYYRTLFERLSALPGVIGVGGATTVPAGTLGPDFERPVWPEGASPDGAQRVPAAVRVITPGYLRTMRMRLIDGRAIDDRDAPKAPPVLMVSESLARRMWPADRAVGQRLMVDYSTAGTYPYEIVGVVGDVRFRGPRSEPLAEIYFSHAQRPYLILNVVIKTAGNPTAIVPGVRDALKSVDAQKPAHGLYPLEDLLGSTYARDRQAMVILLVFAAAAIFLAVLSVYSVLSQRVRERATEIGIRMAIGAGSRRVVSWVALAGMRLIAVGMIVGLAIARAAAGALEGLLYGVKTTDALTLAAVMACLSIVGLLAMLVPSWRATRIDPVVILRRG